MIELLEEGSNLHLTMSVCSLLATGHRYVYSKREESEDGQGYEKNNKKMAINSSDLAGIFA